MAASNGYGCGRSTRTKWKERCLRAEKEQHIQGCLAQHFLQEYLKLQNPAHTARDMAVEYTREYHKYRKLAEELGI